MRACSKRRRLARMQGCTAPAFSEPPLLPTSRHSTTSSVYASKATPKAVMQMVMCLQGEVGLVGANAEAPKVPNARQTRMYVCFTFSAAPSPVPPPTSVSAKPVTMNFGGRLAWLRPLQR